MKKVVSIIVMIVLLTGEVCAQAVSPSRDTLPCGQRQRGYFYTLWYDQITKTIAIIAPIGFEVFSSSTG